MFSWAHRQHLLLSVWRTLWTQHWSGWGPPAQGIFWDSGHLRINWSNVQGCNGFQHNPAWIENCLTFKFLKCPNWKLPPTVFAIFPNLARQIAKDAWQPMPRNYMILEAVILSEIQFIIFLLILVISGILAMLAVTHIFSSNCILRSNWKSSIP